MSAGINVEITESGHGRLIDALNKVGVYSDKAGEKVDKLNSKVEKSGDSAKKAASGYDILQKALGRSHGQFGILEGVVASVTAAFSVGAVIKYADAYTGLESKLKLVTRTQADTNEAMKATFNIAQATRTSWDSIVPIYARVVEGLKGVHRSSKDAAAITTTLAQAVALGGSTAESARAGLYQFQQGLASGVLRGEEFNSVMENTPGLARALALGVDGANGSLGRLRTMANQGLLTTSVLIKALEKAAPTVGKAFAQFTPTVSQSFQVLENSFQNYIGQANSAIGFTSLFSSGLILLSNNIGIVVPILAAFAAMLGVVAATFTIMQFAAAIMQIRTFAATVTTLLAPLAAWAAAQTALLIPLGIAAVEVVAITAAIAAMVIGATLLGTAIYSLVEYWGGLNTVMTFFGTIISTVSGWINTFWSGVTNIATAFMNWYNNSIILNEILSQVGMAVTTFWTNLTGLVAKVWEWITTNQTLNNLLTNIAGVLTTFWGNLQQVWNWVTQVSASFDKWISGINIVGQSLGGLTAILEKLGIIKSADDWTKKLNASFGGLADAANKAAGGVNNATKALSGYEYGAKLADEATQKYVEQQNKLNEALGTGITLKYDSELKQVIASYNTATGAAGSYASAVDRVSSSSSSAASATSSLSGSLNSVAGSYSSAASAASQYASAASAAASAGSSGGGYNGQAYEIDGSSMAATGIAGELGATWSPETGITTGGSGGGGGGGGFQVSESWQYYIPITYDGVEVAQLGRGGRQVNMNSWYTPNYTLDHVSASDYATIQRMDQQFQAYAQEYMSRANDPMISPDALWGAFISGKPFPAEDTGLTPGGMSPGGSYMPVTTPVTTPVTQAATPNMWTSSKSSSNDNGPARASGNTFNFNFPNTDRDAFRRTDRQHLQTFARKMARIAVG